MGMYHSVSLAYGFEIPTTTDLDQLDQVIGDGPDFLKDSVGHHVIGDYDRLLLVTRFTPVAENEVITLTPDTLASAATRARPRTPRPGRAHPAHHQQKGNPMTGRPTTGEARIHLRERAARLYIEGCTIQSTARQIGRSYGCTRTLLLEAGVRLRRPGNPRIGGAR